MSFRTLKYLSFAHSAIYTALLVIAVAGVLDDVKYVLGWAHGIGWIVMSLLCIDAALARRDGCSRRWGRALCGHHRICVCRAASKSSADNPSTRYGLGP